MKVTKEVKTTTTIELNEVEVEQLITVLQHSTYQFLTPAGSKYEFLDNLARALGKR